MKRPTGTPKVVVITGASSANGRGAARALAARGDAVVLVSRSQEALAEVAAECRAAGGRALVVPTDVSDEAAVQRVVARSVDELGRILSQGLRSRRRS